MLRISSIAVKFLLETYSTYNDVHSSYDYVTSADAGEARLAAGSNCTV